MQLQNLKLKGFIGLKKGMGLDEIDLDLSGLSGLVALSGPNGKGKSTILENLSPYPTLASRDGALKHHCFMRDSFRDLSFIYQGDQYRTLIKIDSDSDRSEGYVWKNGESLLDGKISNYKQYVNELFGSPNLFFASVFAAQNADKLNDMTTGELKKLFSEFLRLDRLIQYENTSKSAGNIIAGTIERLNREIEQKKEQLEKRNTVSIDLDRLASTRGTINIQIACDGERRDAHARAITILKESKINAEADRRRLDDLQKTLTSLVNEIRDEKTHGETQLSKLRASLIGIKTELINIGNLLENETEIRKAVERVEALEPILTDSEKEIEELKKVIKASEDQLFSSRSNLQGVLSDIKLLNISTDTVCLEQQIKGLKSQTGSLDLKDPACKSTTCSFIVSALDAVKQLPELEQRLTEMVKAATKDMIKLRDREKRIDADISYLSESLGVKQSALEDHTVKRWVAEDEHKKASDLAKQIANVEVASSRKADLEKQKVEITDRGTEIKERMDQVVKEKEARRAEIETEIKVLNDSIDDEIDSRIKTAETEKLDVEKAIETLEADLFKVAGEITAAKQKLAEFEKVESELREIQESKDRLGHELGDWRYLQLACSKDGLRALEIDSVAPVISGHANDLLSVTFGPSYSVRFETQTPEGKEVLNIYVIREDGSEVLLDNLSGGEKVWNLQALRLAMTLISKEKSGKNFQTFFSDEFDGALDVDNAQNFISLYREFMRIGHFSTGFAITHKPECVAMADHVIEFSKRGVTIQ